MRHFHLLTLIALLAAPAPARAGYDADVDGNGSVTALDCFRLRKMTLGLEAAKPEHSLDGNADITAKDAMLCKLAVLGERPTLAESTIGPVAVGEEVALGAGLNLDQITGIDAGGAAPLGLLGVAVPCTPEALGVAQYVVRLEFTLNGVKMPGSKVTILVDTAKLTTECTGWLGPCAEPEKACVAPCEDGTCIETQSGFVCAAANDGNVCIQCPTGTVPTSGGTCEPQAIGGADPFLWLPIGNPAVVCTTYKGHPQAGCDLPVPVGTDTGSPISGTVKIAKGEDCADNTTPLYGTWSLFANCNGGAGNYVVIVADDGTEVWLEHLKYGSVIVEPGEKVCAGQKVAQSGASGRVMSSNGGTGAHLHVACKISGAWYYPKDLWLDTESYKLGTPCPTAPGPVCGNGKVEGGEACDGADLAGKSCQSQGFTSGVLSCSSCQLDASACCKANAKLGCSGGNVVSVDSCGNAGSVVQYCTAPGPCQTSTCSGGACQTANVPNGTSCGGGKVCTSGSCGCAPNAHKGCYGTSVVWQDSCGNVGSTVETCSTTNPCKAASCSSGSCQTTDVANGTSCGGGKVCTNGSCGCLSKDHLGCSGANVVWVNSCGGIEATVQTCSTADPCQTATCSAGACKTSPMPDGTSCGTGKQCYSGVCKTTACPSGNGLYCSGSTLQQCTNGTYTFSAYCGAGCVTAAAGTNDYCKSGTCPGGNGLYCGGPLGLDATTLYSCTNAKYTVSKKCPSSCKVAPLGSNDYCL